MNRSDKGQMCPIVALLFVGIVLIQIAPTLRGTIQDSLQLLSSYFAYRTFVSPRIKFKTNPIFDLLKRIRIVTDNSIRQRRTTTLVL